MSALIFQHHPDNSSTLVPNDFIENRMAKANGSYVKVYLYLLYACHQHLAIPDTADVAEKLDMLESDVVKALKYWDEQKVLRFSHNDKTGDYSIDFDREDEMSDIAPDGMSGTSGHKDSVIVSEREGSIVRVAQKPYYAPEEMEAYCENPLIEDLFAKAQDLLGRQLSQEDMSEIYSFYDYYRLPADVVLYMIEYCTNSGHYKMRYMEKVAMSWSDKHIDTIEKAREEANYFDRYRPVLRALHSPRNTPTPRQKEIMDHYLDEAGMNMEMLLEAASRTYDSTGTAHFSYMTSILKDWENKGISSMEEVKEDDERHDRQVEKERTSSSSKAKGSGRKASGRRSSLTQINTPESAEYYKKMEKLILEKEHRDVRGDSDG